MSGIYSHNGGLNEVEIIGVVNRLISNPQIRCGNPPNLNLGFKASRLRPILKVRQDNQEYYLKYLGAKELRDKESDFQDLQKKGIISISITETFLYRGAFIRHKKWLYLINVTPVIFFIRRTNSGAPRHAVAKRVLTSCRDMLKLWRTISDFFF